MTVLYGHSSRVRIPHAPLFARLRSEVHLFVTLRQKRSRYCSCSVEVLVYLHRNTLSLGNGTGMGAVNSLKHISSVECHPVVR